MIDTAAGELPVVAGTAAAVGVATLNALIEPPASALEVDVRELIRVRPNDVVGMVGHFGPLISFLRQHAARLHIFERRPGQERDVHPAWTAPILLRECDVVIVTSASLVTRALDGLLERAVRARELVLVSPSTPMLPEVARGSVSGHCLVSACAVSSCPVTATESGG